MPPQRKPLGPVSGNRLLGQHLSPYARGKIAGKAEEGATPASIAKELELEYSTVYRTIQNDLLRHEGKSLPRTPRKKSYSEHDERVLLRHVRANPKDTYREIMTACGLGCKKTTIRKILKEHGITNWKAKRRPFLTEKNAAARLAWCLERRHWLAEDWALVVWSDECSVERGRGKRDEWVFRTPAQKWHRQMIQTYDAKKNMKVMVWAAFWDLGRSSLYIMDRDFESKKHGYSAESYLEVLDAQVGPIFEELGRNGDKYDFMQDNTSIHTAKKVKAWFEARGIDMLENWPPYSPDLNPIEHVWRHLKKLVVSMFPEVAADKSESEEARARLESCLQAAWDCLPDDLFSKLYLSMGKRIEAVIAAKGWHTKY